MATERAAPLTLVVDDDARIRRLVRRTLEAEKWTVLEARNGPEALHLISTDPAIAVLVTDVRMPGMTGIELATAVRSQRRFLPVLYLTGSPDLLFKEQQILRDGEAFLTKPFTRLALLQALHQIVAIHAGVQSGEWRRRQPG